MFSKWIESAKDSASQLLNAGKTVLQDSVQSIQSVSSEINDKATAYFREKMVKQPEDMTYITPNLIAMGFPGNPKTKNIEAQVNKCDITAYYLEARHPNHYMIFNLAEETYDTFLFHDQVVNYNFTGYPAPPLGLLLKICTNIETWIKKDSENVAIVHCYDGKGRTMTICACVMTWMGWFNTPMEALAVCLDRRGLPESAVLPSQYRCLQYFDNLMQGIRPVGDGFTLTSLTIHSLPDIEDNSCSPYIEIYNQNELVYCSYRKGSKTKGIVTPVNAGEDITFTPNITLFGNVFIRCRHLPVNSTKPQTLFRFQFYTGFIKMFKLELASNEVDASVDLSNLHVSCSFTPGTFTQVGEEDPYEALIVKESSSLWSEVLKKKEARMNTNDVKENAFVVASSRSAKRISESTKPEEKTDYVNELKKLESELTNEQNPVPEVPEEGEESMNLDTIIENYKDLDNLVTDMGPIEDTNFNLNDFEEILKNEGAEITTEPEQTTE